MNLENHMRTITEAAHYVRRHLPRSNSIEVCDLVQVGAERVQRYLGDQGSEHRTLVFVCAKQGMFEEARRWMGLPPDRRVKVYVEPQFCPVHDWHRSTSIPIELLIDIKRTLFSMPLREAAAWYSRHMLDEPVGTLGAEFGVTRGMVCLYEIAARKKLRTAVSGGEPLRKSRARIGGAALKRHLVERERYAELRRLGASVQHANRWCKSANTYATAIRQLDAEAAERARRADLQELRAKRIGNRKHPVAEAAE